MRLLPVLFLFGSTLLPVAQAQVLIRVLQDNVVIPVANGGTVPVTGRGVGLAKPVTVSITYTGATSLAFPQSPTLLGSPDFTITSAPPLNAVLGPNQSLSLQLSFLPTSGEQSVAALDYNFIEAGAQTQPDAPPAPSRPGLVSIILNGLTPQFSLNYVLALDNNAVGVPPGGVLQFTDTPVSSPTLANVVLANLGSGPGRLLAASVSGEDFDLIGLPLLPAALASGGNLQFQLRYRPSQPGNDEGTLTLSFEGGATYNVNLRGRAISSFLSYELILPEGPPQSLLPNQVISLPPTRVSESTTVFIRFRNVSAFTLALNGVALSGAAFQLSDLPLFPLNLAPGQQRTFAIIFTPAQAGRPTGRLQIGNDSFDLEGQAIGPILTYSYLSPAGESNVPPLGEVVFPQVPVGQSSPVQFTIRNTGTAPAPIVSASIVSNGRPVFTLQDPPALPTAIEPGSSLTFNLRFQPLATGITSASLRINTDAFVLSGNGTQPEPLPSYTFQGPSSVQPFQQPTIGLTLAAPYPVALAGTLTLSSESESFVSDPSVLFVTGGTVASFSIPAGATRAVFSNGANELRFQTGSVAGAIIVAPSFATASGFDLTPENRPTFRAALPASAPVLLNLSADSRTVNSFILRAVGYSTTRSLSSITLSFTGRPGFNFNTTEFTADITSNSFLWFNSPASATFGGQFVAQIPIFLASSDNAPTATPPIQALGSVTVKISNARGESQTLTLALQ